jgi:hypothetical protein
MPPARRWMNTQPAAADTPTAAPEGQQWSWCVLMDFYEIASCKALLRMDPSANYTQARPSDIWDTYYRYATDATPQASSWTLFFNNWGNVTTPPLPVRVRAAHASVAYSYSWWLSPFQPPPPGIMLQITSPPPPPPSPPLSLSPPSLSPPPLPPSLLPTLPVRVRVAHAWLGICTDA